jgi:hypothetical protein
MVLSTGEKNPCIARRLGLLGFVLAGKGFAIDVFGKAHYNVDQAERT